MGEGDGGSERGGAGEGARPAGWLGRAEVERTALLSALLFLSATVLVVGRTARDALFLTEFPVRWIAPMWMAYAIASALIATLYGRVVSRLPRARFVVAFSAFSALSFVLFWALASRGVGAAILVLYVWTEVIANLVGAELWTFAQDYHDARSAKRFFGFIGAGRIAGTVFSGLLASAIAPLVGTTSLLLVVALALSAVAGLTRITARRHPLPPRRAPGAPPEKSGAPLLRSGYVLAISALTLLLFGITTVGDYQFKAIARASYPSREALAQFMGSFYGLVGAVGLVAQLVVGPFLLRRFGVLGGMAAMPVAYVGSTVALLFAPSLSAATVLKVSDNGLQYTVHESTMQILFFPFGEAERNRVRLLATAMFKPLGYGLGALALLAIAPADGLPPGETVRQAAWLGVYTLPFGLLALALLPLVRRGYARAMHRTLVRPGVDRASLAASPQAGPLLLAALSSPEAPQVVFAVDRLREIEPGAVRRALPRLARHASARVRALALELASTLELEPEQTAALARAGLEDSDAAVRKAAVHALGSALEDDAHDELVALAERRKDPEVRAAAIACLLRHCGLDGMLDGAPRLRALLSSREEGERAEAARVLGMVGEGSLQRALARLLADPAPAVRRAAVSAASAVRDPRLLPLLVEALGERALASEAARAIAAVGPAAIPRLAAELGSEAAPFEARLAMPRVLAGIGTPEALAALLGHLDLEEAQLRQKVLASASRLRLALGAPPLPPGEVRARIDREIALHERLRAGYLAARPLLGRPLLDEYFVARLRKSIIRVLRLCELAYPRDVIASVRAHLFGSDATLRANAFEVMESLLDRALRERLVALVEEVIAMREGAFPEPPGSSGAAEAAAFVAYEAERRDAWAAALALDAAAWRGLREAGPAALGAVTHPSPLVREAAGVALAVTMPEGAREALLRLPEDPDPMVAALGRYWAETGCSGIDPEDAMYTTIEKVLFLQRVPVFANVSGEDLVPLARGALVVPMRRGETIFREGDPSGALYLVVSGSVKLLVKGREVARAREGDVFGEMSIFDREPRAATAVAAEDGDLMRVSAEDFHDAVRETVEIAESVIQVMNRRLREADRQLAAARARLAALGEAERPSATPSSEPPPRLSDGPRSNLARGVEDLE